VRDSFLAASARRNRGRVVFSNAVIGSSESGNTTGRAAITSGRTAGYAPPSASRPSSWLKSSRVVRTWRNAQFSLFAVRTAKPVEAIGISGGSIHRKYAPRSGRTVEIAVSPCRNRRRARPGSSPRLYRVIVAISPRITSLISMWSMTSSLSLLLNVQLLNSAMSLTVPTHQPSGWGRRGSRRSGRGRGQRVRATIDTHRRALTSRGRQSAGDGERGPDDQRRRLVESRRLVGCRRLGAHHFRTGDASSQVIPECSQRNRAHPPATRFRKLSRSVTKPNITPRSRGPSGWPR